MNSNNAFYTYPIFIAIAFIGVVCFIALITVVITTAVVNSKAKAKDGAAAKIVNNTAAIVVLSVIVGLSLVMQFFIAYRSLNSNGDENGSQLLSRSATLNDLTITGDDLDLSTFSEKLSFNPKYDINGLVITFKFQKTDGTVLKTIEKPVGNVKEGNTYSVSVSFSDIADWSIISNFNNLKCYYSVTSGIVLYF